MSSSFLTIPQRLGITTEQWKALIWSLRCEMRVALPGVVQSFDAQKQTVKVQLAVQEQIKVNFVPEAIDIPALVDVPVVLPRAGGFSVTLPIKQGDECLVIFGDMCADAWWQNGGTKNQQMERRRHDLSDGYAIFAPWSQPRVLADYSTTSMQIRSDDGNVIIDLADSGTVSLKADLIVQGNLTVQNDLTVESDTTLAGNVEMQASLTVDENLSVEGTAALQDTTIQGRDFTHHIHSGVTPGGSDTGPPV